VLRVTIFGVQAHLDMRVHFVFLLLKLNLFSDLREESVSNVFEGLDIVADLADGAVDHGKRLECEVLAFVSQHVQHLGAVPEVGPLVLQLGLLQGLDLIIGCLELLELLQNVLQSY